MFSENLIYNDNNIKIGNVKWLEEDGMKTNGSSFTIQYFVPDF